MQLISLRNELFPTWHQLTSGSKGENVSENVAIHHNFYQWKLVSSGPIEKITVEMYVDSEDEPGNQCRNKSVRSLCQVVADVSHIPENQVTKRKGTDGKLYYDLECKLEAVCKYICLFPLDVRPSNT